MLLCFCLLMKDSNLYTVYHAYWFSSCQANNPQSSRGGGGGARVFKEYVPAHLPPPLKKKNTDVSVVNKVGFLCKCHTQQKKTFKMLALNLLLLPKAQNFDHWSNYSTKIHTTL